MGFKLILIEKDNQSSFNINEESIIIGRSSKSEIKVNDVKCSAKHCKIFLESGKLTVEDLNSSNGTYLDNLKITTSQILIYQLLKIGKTVLFIDVNELTDDEKKKHFNIRINKDSKDFIDRNLKYIQKEDNLEEKTDKEEVNSNTFDGQTKLTINKSITNLDKKLNFSKKTQPKEEKTTILRKIKNFLYKKLNNIED